MVLTRHSLTISESKSVFSTNSKKRFDEVQPSEAHSRLAHRFASPSSAQQELNLNQPEEMTRSELTSESKPLPNRCFAPLRTTSTGQNLDGLEGMFRLDLFSEAKPRQT